MPLRPPIRLLRLLTPKRLSAPTLNQTHAKHSYDYTPHPNAQNAVHTCRNTHGQSILVALQGIAKAEPLVAVRAAEVVHRGCRGLAPCGKIGRSAGSNSVR